MKISKTEILEIHKLLKTNISNNSNYFDLFLLDLFYFMPNNIISNISEFKENLNKTSFGILNDNFPWNNIVIAGGASLECLSSREIPHNQYSDIDLWIYGKPDEIIETHQIVLEYFETFAKMQNLLIYYSVNYQVVTIIIEGIRKNFQIIVKQYEHKYEIINNFDLDYVQCLYDGNQVLGTCGFITAINTQTTTYVKLFDTSNKKQRIAKAILKGFDINNNIVPCAE